MIFETAGELMGRLDRGEVSSLELLDLFLDQVDRVDDDVNAIVTLDAEVARERARVLDDERARGSLRGPLHGLPMTIKDSFETAGLRTTSGVPFLADHVPERDADTVARLRDAGANVFAKTNLPFMSADGQSYNDVSGTTNNPWNLDRTPGGSSGGSSAALAAGMSPLELGGDIAGSIRIPASFSGVYGLKTTYGIISSRGMLAGRPGLLARRDLTVPGPLARAVDDLELELDVLAGPAPDDAVAWRLELPPARGRALTDYRLRVWLDDPACPVDRETVAVLRRAVDALSDAGARIEEGPPPVPLADSIRIHRSLLKAVACSGLTDEGFVAMQERAREGGDGVHADHARWLTMSKRDWNAIEEERAQARARWAAFFEDHDALLTPTILRTAIEHDHSPVLEDRKIVVNGERRDYWDQVCWIAPASAAYLPAVSMPAGLAADGLPVGLQITAPYLEDRTALDVARCCDPVLGGFVAPPRFAGQAA